MSITSLLTVFVFFFLKRKISSSTITVLNSHEYKPVWLTSDSNEIIFEYKNQNFDSDIICQFQNAHSFTEENQTIAVYVYTNKDEIKQDEQGNYMDFNWKFQFDSLNKDALDWYISSSDTSFIPDSSYFFVWRTYHEKEEYNNNFMCYNEREAIKVSREDHNNNNLIFHRFYSTKCFLIEVRTNANKLFFQYLRQRTDSILSTTIYDKKKGDVYKEINGNTYSEIIVGIDEKEFLITICNKNNDSDYSNDYLWVVFNHLDGEYQNINSFVDYRPSNTFSYWVPTSFEFEFDMSKWQVNNEFVIIVKCDLNNYSTISNVIHDGGLNNAPIPNKNDFPVEASVIEDTNINITKITGVRPTEGKDNKINLLIKLDFNVDNIRPEIYKFNIYVAVDIIELDLTYFDFYKMMKLTPYIPKHFKLKLNQNDGNLKIQNYIKYISKYSKVFFGNLLTLRRTESDPYVINPKQSLDPLVYISHYAKYPNNTVSVEMFNNQNIEITIPINFISTESSFLILNQEKMLTERDKMLIAVQIRSCLFPFYIIGLYSTRSQAILIPEHLYGKYTVYYKDSLSSTKFKDNLPGESNSILVKNYHEIESEVDLIGVKCESPSLLNIKLVNYSMKDTLSSSDYYIGLFNIDEMINSNANQANHWINSIKILAQSSTVYLSLRSYSNGLVQVNITDSTFVLDSVNPTKLLNFDNDSTLYFTSKVNAWMEFKIGSTDLYYQVPFGRTKLAHLNNIFILDIDTNYSQFGVYLICNDNTTSTVHYIEFNIGYGNQWYIPWYKNKLNKFQYSFSYNISSPYNKHLSHVNENEFYYVSVVFEELYDDVDIIFNRYEKERYPVLDENKYFVVRSTTESQYYSIPHNYDENKELVIKANNCKMNQIFTFVLLDDKVDLDYYYIPIGEKGYLLKLGNYYSDLTLHVVPSKLESEVLIKSMYMNKEKSNETPDKINTAFNYVLDKDLLTLSFENPFDITHEVKYSWYIYNQNDRIDITSECSISTIWAANSTNSTQYNKALFLSYNTNHLQNGIYVLNVLIEEWEDNFDIIALTQKELKIERKDYSLFIYLGVGILVWIILLILFCLLYNQKKKKIDDDLVNFIEDDNIKEVLNSNDVNEGSN